MAHYSKHFTLSRHPSAFILLLLALAVGCGQSNPLGRQAVSGRVTFDGAALDQGMISFSPESRQGISGGAVIRNGDFSIPAAKGLPPGTYIVRINSAVSDPTQEVHSASFPGTVGVKPGVERIAPTYNANSKLVAEVVAGRTAAFDFDTASK